MPENTISYLERIKRFFVGAELNLGDRGIFHRLSLIAFFAWVGLGADGLSSSSYGPSEAYAVLGEHTFLAILVGLASMVTIFIISASYSQIIELFPHGGGGYYVASTLLSPKLGMLSGCALAIDYVLTITLSIASGADAIFSLLPPHYLVYKVPVAVCALLVLTTLNLRGVKESVAMLVPVFLLFVVTHAFVIGYALFTHAMDAPVVYERLQADIAATHSELGMVGMLLLLLKAFSMGAGTYTGIEAVSNGLPMLREPRVETGKRTMMYMAVSLSVTVMGLMVAYSLYKIQLQPGKTLNTLLVEALTSDWSPGTGNTFLYLTLGSEAMLLFAAAQTGFLDGPRVLANMALDRWIPARFAVLSDRLVTRNGILLFGGAALILMVGSEGSVTHLVVLYSINVFITFVLSQLGMVRHWWIVRAQTPGWRRKLAINGLGLIITSFILVCVTLVKFEEGGWLTLVVTLSAMAFALVVRQHYDYAGRLIKKLDPLLGSVKMFGLPVAAMPQAPDSKPDQTTPTAVMLVSGYNGLGLFTLREFLRYHGHGVGNFIFVSIGIVDVGAFRSPDELEKMKQRLAEQTQQYTDLVKDRGFHAEAIWAVGTDVVDEVMKLAPTIRERYPRSLFFSGQLVFKDDGMLTRMLHNYQSFSLQRRCFQEGIPFMVVPVRIEEDNLGSEASMEEKS